MKQFNVIFWDCHKKEFIPYDIMEYLYSRFTDARPKDKPTTREELKKFIKDNLMYQYWSRTEYEMIIHDWPCDQVEEKWDIYKQAMMNHDIITDILMEEINKHKRTYKIK